MSTHIITTTKFDRPDLKDTIVMNQNHRNLKSKKHHFSDTGFAPKNIDLLKDNPYMYNKYTR